MKLYIYLNILFLVVIVYSGGVLSEQNNYGFTQFNSKIQNKYYQNNTNAFIAPLSNGNSKSLKIITWNIKDLGQTKDTQEIHAIAKLLKQADVVAIQEVVAIHPGGAQAVAKIADELNRTGSKWDYRISDPTKSPSSHMSERYAFLWKTSKLQLLQPAFLDETLENDIIREPYIAKFKLKKGTKPFYLVNVHSRVFSQNPQNEIIFFKDYPKRFKSNRIFIVGDFNLNEKHEVWDNLYNMGFESSLKETPTTLKRKCKSGKYLNHTIDNIYFNTAHVQLINAAPIDFVNTCDNLEQARYLSDHLPVFLDCLID